ncbi:MAG: sigma-70 family RNA polymerase sigma factor [Flavobacteriia bacterium]|nr:sigma-70 family RNA polymerase sigma factor [Flavobacteriia bacterium]
MISNLSDLELISIVKLCQDNSSDAMKEIITRHSGIFIEMVNHFVPCNSPYCSREDFINEKEYYIYKALMKYDENRGAKFSTHLGNEAKWLCLNTYNKNKNKQEFPASDYNFDKNLTEEPHKESIRREAYKNIINAIDNHPDSRVKKIFTMRYIQGEKNKLMPWKKISKELDMSIQGCINIHNSAIEKIKTKIK